jgi:hypothetical protein
MGQALLDVTVEFWLFFDPCAIFGNNMFNTIRVAHSFMKLSYVGGEGVEGGQGELWRTRPSYLCRCSATRRLPCLAGTSLISNAAFAGENDIIYGDHDLSVRLNVKSGLGDFEGMPDYATGEIYVRA